MWMANGVDLYARCFLRGNGAQLATRSIACSTGQSLGLGEGVADKRLEVPRLIEPYAGDGDSAHGSLLSAEHEKPNRDKKNSK